MWHWWEKLTFFVEMQ
jgi:hypothetical protein